MTDDELKHLVVTDPNFINLKRFNFSIEELLKRYETGVPDHIIANGLMISEHKLNTYYKEIIEKLRILLKVENE